MIYILITIWENTEISLSSAYSKRVSEGTCHRHEKRGLCFRINDIYYIYFEIKKSEEILMFYFYVFTPLASFFVLLQKLLVSNI